MSVTRAEFVEAIEAGIAASNLSDEEQAALRKTAQEADRFTHRSFQLGPGCPAVLAGIYHHGRLVNDPVFARFVCGFDDHMIALVGERDGLVVEVKG